MLSEGVSLARKVETNLRGSLNFRVGIKVEGIGLYYAVVVGVENLGTTYRASSLGGTNLLFLGVTRTGRAIKL